MNQNDNASNSAEQLEYVVDKANINNQNAAKNANDVSQKSFTGNPKTPLHNSLDNPIINTNKNKNLQAEALKSKMQNKGAQNPNKPKNKNGSNNSRMVNELASKGVQAAGIPKPLADKLVNSKLGQKAIEKAKQNHPALNMLDKLMGGGSNKEDQPSSGDFESFKIPKHVKKKIAISMIPISLGMIFIILFVSASQIMIKSIGLGNADETSASDAENKINSNLENANENPNDSDLNEEITDDDISYNYYSSNGKSFNVTINRKNYAEPNNKNKSNVRDYQEADLEALEDFYGGNLKFDNTSNMETVVSFYLKLRDIHVRYAKKGVELDLPLIMSTLMLQSDDMNVVFISNTSEKYDRTDIDNASSSTLDPDYDWSGYMPSANNSAHDIEILAQHMVSQDENGSYRLDEAKYKEYLKEFLEIKYFINADGSMSGSNNNNNNSCTQTETAFTKYALTDDQVLQIASLCQREQGSAKGAAAEASLMANRFEIYGKKYGSGANGLYNYIRKSKWWHSSASIMDSKKASDDIVQAVKNVLVNGYRTLPGYVDEHDCISCGSYGYDIQKITVNGKTITDHAGLKNKSNYIKHSTVLYNRYGSTYTFYSFPTETSDPFGYTSVARKNAMGDFHYEYGSTQATGCTNSSIDSNVSNQYAKALITLANNEYTNKQGYNDGEKYNRALGFPISTAWCANFVSWLSINTKVNDVPLYPNIVPFKTARCTEYVKYFANSNKENIKFYYNDSCSKYAGKNGNNGKYTPKPGDFILFDWNKRFVNVGDTSKHIGIVEKVENGTIYTIEGNSGNKVNKVKYKVNNCAVIGFGSWY